MFLRIQEDLKTAMKSADQLRVSVLRMVLSELNYKKIDLQRDLTEEDVIAVVQKEVKKRKEAIESYTKGDRLDQAKQEQQELEILQVYLPAQMSEDEIRTRLQTEIVNGKFADFGSAMRVISPIFKGKADGAMVARIVRELLGGV